jgi:ADP-glucose pyrophosphorylase
VFAYRFDGYWQDIGTPEAYYQAHMDLINGIFPFTIGGISGLVSVDNSRNSIIGENCVVNGQVENSILYPGVFVSENATVRNAVVMAKTLIGYSSTVCGCIIDEEVEIGDYARVGAVTPFPTGSNQVPIINRGTIIPSYANMGNNRGIADFGAYSDIFSGLVLTKDLGDKDLISIAKR